MHFLYLDSFPWYVCEIHSYRSMYLWMIYSLWLYVLHCVNVPPSGYASYYWQAIYFWNSLVDVFCESMFAFLLHMYAGVEFGSSGMHM